MTSERSFTEADLKRIEATTMIASIEYHASLASTNDFALNQAANSASPLPQLVLADRQSAGRGRGHNRWWSHEGALTFSLLMPTVSAAILPQTALAAGLAVCEALAPFATDACLRVKWPNDVYAGQRKLCGILAEVPPTRNDLVVLGIGVNVNTDMAHGPRELSASATSLCHVVGKQFPLVDVLVPILDHLEEKLQWLVEDSERLMTQWRARCLLTGQPIAVELPNYCVWGICAGIDDEGALLLNTTAGQERCLAGTVRFRE